MAKRTLLEIVQSILGSMESDKVNSIEDTSEATLVAEIVRDVFFDLHSNKNWEDKKELVSLVSLADTSKPTHMKVQDDFTEMVSLRYDKRRNGETRKRYEPVSWKEPDDFLRYTNVRNSDATNVDVVSDVTGVELLVINDKHPTYYTSFDDYHLVFDSYDKTVDSVLQESKVQAMAYVYPTFTISDSFVPDMPIEAFSTLVNEARSRCQFWLKDFQDAKSEQEAGRQRRWQARKSWTVNGGIQFPNYGRKSRKSYKDPTLSQRHITDT